MQSISEAGKEMMQGRLCSLKAELPHAVQKKLTQNQRTESTGRRPETNLWLPKGETGGRQGQARSMGLTDINYCT